MKEIILFFKASSKRFLTLKNKMGHQLNGLCETRWVERHDRVLQFREALTRIHDSLEFVSSSSGSSTAAKTKTLKSALHESEFIATVLCLRFTELHSAIESSLSENTN